MRARLGMSSLYVSHVAAERQDNQVIRIVSHVAIATNTRQWNSKAKRRGVSIATVSLSSTKKSRHWRRRSLPSIFSGELSPTPLDVATRRSVLAITVSFIAFTLQKGRLPVIGCLH